MTTRYLAVMLFCVSALLASACSAPTYYRMTPAPTTPAAEGQVAVKEESNNNLSLEIKVFHLPPPENLAGNLDTFVVWLKPADSEKIINLGALNIGDNRKGKLKTTTPYRDFALFVTAEPSGQVDRPGQHLVLRRDITFTR